MLTTPVRIDQSEGIADPDIPERPFVKFTHGCSFAFSRDASPLWRFSRALQASRASKLDHALMCTSLDTKLSPQKHRFDAHSFGERYNFVHNNFCLICRRDDGFIAKVLRLVSIHTDLSRVTTSFN